MRTHALLSTSLDSPLRGNLNSASQNYIPRVEISQLNVIYNEPHLSLLMHTRYKLTRSALLILTTEIKQDIMYRHMNLPPSAGQVTNTQRLMAHLDSTLWRLQSYSQYIRLAKFGKAISALQTMHDINLELPWTLKYWIWPCFLLSPLYILRDHMTQKSYPLTTLPASHRSIYSAPYSCISVHKICLHTLIPTHM